MFSGCRFEACLCPFSRRDVVSKLHSSRQGGKTAHWTDLNTSMASSAMASRAVEKGLQGPLTFQKVQDNKQFLTGTAFAAPPGVSLPISLTQNADVIAMIACTDGLLSSPSRLETSMQLAALVCQHVSGMGAGTTYIMMHSQEAPNSLDQIECMHACPLWPALIVVDVRGSGPQPHCMLLIAVA